MNRMISVFVAFCFQSGAFSVASAGSLQTSTVSLDINAPAAASAIVLRNTGQEPISAQVRVFSWRQNQGREELVPTEEVAASPPLATLEPGRDYTVRIVRLAGRKVEAEEAYRLLVDELPGATSAPGLGVKFALRYSIPVFFGPASRHSNSINWSAQFERDALKLIATNGGNRHVRIASLKLTNENGEVVVARNGLFGYVLSGSSMTWTLLAGSFKSAGSHLILSAQSDHGPINADVAVQRSP